MNCPGCGKSGLKRITYIPFIAEHGDVWECPNCTLLSTDFAVHMYNNSYVQQMTNYICHKCGKTTNTVRANDHLCMECVEEWYNER